MSDYTSDNIHLSGELEHIRTNIELYAGEKGTHDPTHLIFEVLDNALDEVSEDYADTITVSINEKGNTITVGDNGRGIPVDKKDGQYVPFVISTKLFSSGKAKNQNNKGYKKPTAGLHGIGMTLVNALSKMLVYQIFRNDKEYRFPLENGIPKEVVEIEDVKNKGTVVNFMPDSQYFETLQVDYERLEKRLVGVNHSLQNKLKKINYYINGKPKKIESDYCKYKFGIPRGPMWIKIESKYQDELFRLELTWDVKALQLMMKKNTPAKPTSSSIVNHIVLDDGTHLNYANDVIKEAFSKIAKKEKYTMIKDVDFNKGLQLLVVCELIDKSFNGQDKSKLATKRQYYVERFNDLVDLVYDKLYNDKNIFNTITKPLLDILQQYRLSIDTSIKKADIKSGGKVSRSLDVDGLSDCISLERNKCTLYIVEGESAGGNVLQIRDDNYHAVLFLKGKIANVTKSSIDKILKNKIIRALIDTIGIGYRHKNMKEDIKNVRYNNIVILTDADPDGKEIEALLLLVFNVLLPSVIEHGLLKIAKQPLYGAINKNTFIPIYNKFKTRKDEHGNDILTQELDPTFQKYDSDKKFKMKRFKGLGEMEAEYLGATLFSKHAQYITVESKDFENDSKYMDNIMNDPEFKRQFMADNGIYKRDINSLLSVIKGEHDEC